MFRVVSIFENKEHGMTVSYTAALGEINEDESLGFKQAAVTLPNNAVIERSAGGDIVSVAGLGIGKDYDLNFNPAATPVASKLETDLVNILSRYVGETGASEGAVDVLVRLVNELSAYRAKVDQTVTAPKIDG